MVERIKLSGGVSRIALDQTGVTRIGSAPSSVTRIGGDYSPLEKIEGFAKSTVESFPELFGIEPTEETQGFRAVNPVSGFLSQAVGAFVPYMGAARALKAIPAAEGFIAGARGLGGTSKVAQGALGMGAEAALLEAGRVGLTATGLPEAIYEGATGRDAETRSLGTVAGEGLLNIGGSAVLGGAFGGLAARFAKGTKIQDLVPGAEPDLPLAQQARALNDTVSQALDPQNPFELPEEGLARLARERDQRIRFNLQDVEPNYTDTGETIRGDFRPTLGRVYRDLEGETKSTPIGSFLNRANNWITGKPDKGTVTRRMIYDPMEIGGYSSADELADDLTVLGKSREELGMNAQDIKTIEAKAGSGNQPLPKDYVSPLDWIRDKVGRIEDFYHGTNENITDWKPGYRGGVSLSMNPKFASDWAEMKAAGSGKGARVYVAAIKKDRLGDFQNPEDLERMLAEFKSAPKSTQELIAKGNWQQWENLEKLKKIGWDTVYMVEDPYAPAGSTGASKNIFVTKPELISSSFDPKVLWAKNMRLHASEPAWNKPTEIADKDMSSAAVKARTLQKKFTSKPWADVGDGWRLAKEKDGLFVMAKKIRGGEEARPGDRWAFFRTDNPGFFAEKAARSNDAFMRSAYWPKPSEMASIGDPLFDASATFLRETADQPFQKLGRKRGPVGAVLRDVGETVGTYAAPSAPLGTRNPMLNRGMQYLQKMVAVTEGRVDQLMRGSRTLQGEKSLLRNVVTVDKPSTAGLASKIDELVKADLDDIKFVLESEIPFEELSKLLVRKDINGDPLISQKAYDFLQAMQLISDDFTGRVSKLQGVLQDQGAMKLVAEFQARKGHYAMTREFPGAYRTFLQGVDGEVVGMATGPTPQHAREAAKEIIETQAKKGNVIYEGGMMDEVMRSPDEMQKLKTKVLRPGFLKNRGDLLGYDLQRGDLTTDKLRELVEKNIRRREEYVRNVSILEHMGETMAQLTRTAPQDAIALNKRIQILVNKDEGEFGRVQNALVDKALNAVGFSGKDSASQIVRTTQKLLTSFQMNFGNLTQPILNMVGMFQTILPEISYVLHASEAALSRNYVSMPLLDSANNVKGTLGVLSEWKVFGNAMQRMGVSWENQPKDFQELVLDMIAQRQLSPRFAEEQFGVDGAILKKPLDAFKSTQSFVKYFESANELLISKSEELNRMMVVNSAYELAKMRNMPYSRMVNFTREMMGKTAFNYSTADRATVFTTPLGSLAGTFKNWMFHYMANMIKYATGGKETLPALMWQTAATAVIGGGAATPFVMPIADGASKFLTDKKFSEMLYSMTGGDGMDERVADGLIYGLPGSMGLSFASQAASPGSDPKRDAAMMFSFAAFDRVKALSGATKDALVAYKVTGESPWEDEIVRGEMARALAPRTIYRSMALSQDSAVKSLTTGYDVTKPMGLGTALLYGAGFNPTELEKTYDVYNEIRDSQESERALVKEFGQTLAQAWENGDDRLANRVFTRAMAVGVDTSSVLRSAEARTKRGAETQLEFTASPEQEEQFGYMFNEGN